MTGLPSWDTQSLASAFSTATLQQPLTNEWYFDSGATSHITSSSSNLSHFTFPRYPTPSSIVVGDGSLLPVVGTGSTELSHSLFLNNVLVSPQIIKNLISVRQFTIDNNCSVEFDPAGCSVKGLQTRNVIVRCYSSGALYPLHLPPAQSLVAKATSPLWHRCLGHPGHEVLSKLASSVSTHLEDCLDLCHACQLGRHVRLPFHASASRASNKFDLIHCDLWTSPVVSISGYKYYLVILDDCTHYLWTFPLRVKSDTFSTLATFIAYASTQFSTAVKAIQCDNRHELITPAFVPSSSARASTFACLAPTPHLRTVKLNASFGHSIMLFARCCFRRPCPPRIGLRHSPPQQGCSTYCRPRPLLSPRRTLLCMALHRCMTIYRFLAANVIPTCPPQLLTNSPQGLPYASSSAIPTVTKDTAALTSPPIASSSRGMSSLMKLPFPLLIAMDHALLRPSSFLILLTLCLILLDHNTRFCLQEFSPAILDHRQPPQAPPRLRPRTLWCRPLCRRLRLTSHQDGACRPPPCHARHRRPFPRHARDRRHRPLRPRALTASRLRSARRRCPERRHARPTAGLLASPGSGARRHQCLHMPGTRGLCSDATRTVSSAYAPITTSNVASQGCCCYPASDQPALDGDSR
jgi:hypothetical protein